MHSKPPETRGLRIGIVSPYSWDIPGGAQQHIRDLAKSLIQLGHSVSVIAPCDEAITADYPYLVSAGKAVPVPYNGSVARLCFGFSSASKVRRWLSEGDFDVVHVHEPTAPSIALIATWFAECPLVATFHAAMARSMALSAAAPVLQSALEKISVRIAVSEAARESLVSRVGGDALLIPNGVHVDSYRQAEPLPGWPARNLSGKGRTVGFLGRIDDQRKGLAVLLGAFNIMARQDSEVRLLVAGPGDQGEALKKVPKEFRDRVHFTGLVNETEKVSALHSMDVYCAPNLGGESFGIVLAEAMASAAPVVVSDIDAFTPVILDGRAGVSFRAGDSAHLAAELLSLLADGERRQTLSIAALEAVRAYDWGSIATEVAKVYEAVTHRRVVNL
jgi:phosphatidyl-myo-inositol alpha-mannosyltransferase